MMLPSPYSPGSAPQILAGRREQMDSAEADLASVATFGRFLGRVRVDVGPRGVGKTSLLKTVQESAGVAGLVTAWVTARADESTVAGLVHSLAAGLDLIGIDVAGHRQLRERLQTLTLQLGAGPAKAGVQLDVSSPDPGAPAASAVLGQFISAAATAARERGSGGLCLLVDEIQTAPRADLRTLAYAWQELQLHQPEPPAVLFAAGLPNAPDVLTAAVTFSERFAFRALGRLKDSEAREALVVPAGLAGVTWDPRLLEAAIDLAQGYPYFLQLYGDAVWRVARPVEGDVLAASHLAGAQRVVDLELETMFRARWAKASAGEQRLLAAMAEAGDQPMQRADIAARLGLTSNDLSVPRRSLLDKGLIEVADRGRLRFSTPGFGAFVRAEVED